MVIRFKRLGDVRSSALYENAPYLAGLIDGEGSFVIHKREHKNRVRFTPMIVLGMTHEETVKFAAGIFNVSYVLQKRQPPNKEMFRFQVRTPTDIEIIATALHEPSITKREQIEVFLEFIPLERIISEIKHNDPRYRDAYLEMVEKYVELRKLNRRGKPPNYEVMQERLKKKVMKEFREACARSRTKTHDRTTARQG